MPLEVVAAEVRVDNPFGHREPRKLEPPVEGQAGAGAEGVPPRRLDGVERGVRAQTPVAARPVRQGARERATVGPRPLGAPRG